MELELVELENLSDLENLLAIAEGEFCIADTKTEDIIHKRVDSDCYEIINPSKVESSPFIRSITNSIAVAKNRVQSSISNFFKPPKRLPEEISTMAVVIDEKVTWKRVKNEGVPFVFPAVKRAEPFKSTVPNAKIPPKYKMIPGTPFSVDAFSYGTIDGITGYFLTHFHSDHYKGLSNKLFSTGSERLYCSEITGNLVQKELKIKKEVITTLKIGNVYEIDGIQVGVLDANQ